MTCKDITVVCTFHDEDYLVGASIASLKEAIEASDRHDVSVELIFAIDRPTEITKRLITQFGGSLNANVFEFDLGDQGLVRNECVKNSNGTYVSFMDGDDMFGYDWLWSGKKMLDGNENYIIHPEINIFFEGRQSVFVHMPSNDPFFDYDYFRMGNYWDAMCVSSREIFLDFPYRERDLVHGFAYEDWDWNMRTLANGLEHHVALNTVHFKRARKISQSKRSRDRGVVHHINDLSYYDNDYYAIEEARLALKNSTVVA